MHPADDDAADATNRPGTGRHVVDELPALLGGELTLVEVAAGISLMRRLDENPTVAAIPATGAHDVATARARRSRSRATLLIAATVALVFAGVVTATTVLLNRSDDGPTARVALAPVSGASARGSIAMRDAGAAQAMDVTTSLGVAPTHGYYEVWLLDRTSGKMLPVGVLPPDGRGTYRLSGDVLARYDTVDISLQPDNGRTQHSDDSVLRADYA